MKTKYDIALRIIEILKMENDKLSKEVKGYKMPINLVEEVYALNKLLKNQFIPKE